MKVGFAQLNPRVGDCTHNIEKIKEAIQVAVKEKARLIVFPELAITGYPLRDLLDFRTLVDENLAAIESLAPLSKQIAILVGYVERNKSKTGKPYHNAAAFLEGGRVVGRYLKRLLPFYDVFEEERFFESGKEPGFFALDGKKIGVTICEDIWNLGDYLERAYEENLIADYKSAGLNLLINLSASPFHLHKPETRLSLGKEISSQLRAPFILCNQVGANDELIFDGSSFAMLPNGSIAAQVPSFQTGVGFIDTDGSQTQSVHYSTNSSEWHKGALVLGIRDYVRKCGASKVCLGLSGGIDSAVVAALAVEAVGKENVLTLNMPSAFSSKESQKDALLIASNLGIDCKTIPIDSIYQQMKDAFKGELKSLTQENLQPRIRMTLLMALSNETGAHLLNTSNKSELSAGFATLYGDSAGALSVLGDLKKYEVYELGRFLNQKKAVIPQSVFDRAPSAELKENQKDEDVLPPYKDLDRIVVESVEEFKTEKELLKIGIPQSSVEKFKRLHGYSEFKRRQFPPILRVTEKAFGMGRRMPVAAKAPL